MKLKNQKGAAIITVLIVMATMTALVYLNMYRRNLIAQTNIKREANADIEEMVTNIGNIFLSPKDCNTNFYLKVPSSGSNATPSAERWGEGMQGSFTTAIYKCSNATCSNSSTPQEVVYNFHSPTSNWMYNSPGTTKRARLISATWSIATGGDGQVPPYYPSFPTTPSIQMKAAKATVTLNFQKNLSPFSKLTKISNGYTWNSNLNASTESYNVDAYVIVLDGPVTSPSPGVNRIKGCATTGHSATVY